MRTEWHVIHARRVKRIHASPHHQRYFNTTADGVEAEAAHAVPIIMRTTVVAIDRAAERTFLKLRLKISTMLWSNANDSFLEETDAGAVFFCSGSDMMKMKTSRTMHWTAWKVWTRSTTTKIQAPYQNQKYVLVNLLLLLQHQSITNIETAPWRCTDVRPRRSTCNSPSR
jgi:hypothetical protein